MSQDWWDLAMASWLPGLLEQLAPQEMESLGSPQSGETAIEYMTRVARTSRRAKARGTALANLSPAARDRLNGVVDLAVDRLLNDTGRYVRYEACKLLAIAHVPATLDVLQEAWDKGLDVPWEGISDAYRAVKMDSREGFYNRPGWPGRTGWVLQDEQTDFKNGGYYVKGSPAYGTQERTNSGR